MMEYCICEDCKIVYGHPTRYCPGCPKEMKRIELNSSEIDSLFEQKWKGEELEFIYKGKIYYGTSQIRLDFISNLPEQYKWITDRHLRLNWQPSLRKFNFYVENDCCIINFKDQIYYRAKGSTVYQSFWPKGVL